MYFFCSSFIVTSTMIQDLKRQSICGVVCFRSLKEVAPSISRRTHVSNQTVDSLKITSFQKRLPAGAETHFTLENLIPKFSSSTFICTTGTYTNYILTGHSMTGQPVRNLSFSSRLSKYTTNVRKLENEVFKQGQVS